MRLGIDIGGAFTDLVAYDEKTGEIIWVKDETTPKDPSDGVIKTIKKSMIDVKKIEMIIHGQTVVINSIITRNGAKVALLTTKGHRDILIMQRANRRDIYNFTYKKPEPFVPRYLTYEVNERISSDGKILKEISEDEIKSILTKILQENVESICISFLNSYVNPVHELKVKQIIENELNNKKLKDIPITMSHEISREWGEYERTNTAVLNAYVKPKIKDYLSKIENEVNIMGYNNSYFTVLSNGGISLFDFTKNFPIYSIESGPVAGVIGAIALGEILGERNIIVLDGGSTTTKASLVENLLPKVISEYYVGRDKFNSGYPVKIPVIEIEEVGNGGTSIAWIDEIGNLRVGPMATGADPGPACYGKGGKDPTVTDAYLVNGLINPNYLLGGKMKIFKDLAIEAIKNKISNFYKISVEEASEGIIKIANENAANAIRIISVQKGYDPRDFTLIAHGGSGPMFAPFIAQELEIGKIIIPTIPPGVFSAWGMLITDIRHDLLTTNVVNLNSESLEIINTTYDEMDKKMLDIFYHTEKIGENKLQLFHYGDLRYKGQEHTVKIPINKTPIKENDLEIIISRFHEYHEREYGFKLIKSAIEIVNFHVIGIAKLNKPKIVEIRDKNYSEKDALKEERTIFLNGIRIKLPVYDRNRLPLNKILYGPAILEDPTSTVLVLEDQYFERDKYGNIVIKKRR
ncbi:MAG: hydantoinase/oxoprolinase family protein [Thermoplasmata archaeon]